MFAHLQRALLDELNPIGPLQSILAERIIASTWRLRRALGIEQEIFIRLAARAEPDGPVRFTGAGLALLDDRGRGSSILERLSRYETHLHRCFHKDLQKLHSLQKKRGPSPLPALPFLPSLPRLPPVPKDPSLP